MVNRWRVEIRNEAVDELKALDQSVAQRIMKKLRWLSENFEAIVPEPLTGSFKGTYKLRAGAYRIIYAIDRQREVIVVISVGHRKDIYEEG